MSKIRINLFYNIILSGTQILFPIVTFPYASRILGPDGVGLVSFAESICRYFLLLAALGIPIYGVREISKARNNKQNVSKLFSEIFFLHVITTVFVAILYIICIAFIPKMQINYDLFIWGILMIVFNLFTVEWLFMGYEDFKFVTIRSLIIRVLAVVYLFYYVKNPEDYVKYFLLTVFTTVANGLVNLFFSYKLVKLDFNFSTLNLKKHLRPLLLIFSTTVAISIYILMDTILLGFLSTDTAVGYYTAALKMNKITLLVVGALGTVLIPKLSEIVSKQDDVEFSRLISQSLNFVLTITVPVTIAIVMLSPEIIYLFSGKGFDQAILTMRILSPITLFIGLSNVFGLQILTPLSKDKELMISVIIGTFVSLLLNFILIPRFNENGAAISNVIAELTVMTLTYFKAKKYIKISLPSELIFKNIIFAVPYFCIILLFKLIFSESLMIIVFSFSISLIYFTFSQCYLIKNPLVLNIVKSLNSKYLKNDKI